MKLGRIRSTQHSAALFVFAAALIFLTSAGCRGKAAVDSEKDKKSEEQGSSANAQLNTPSLDSNPKNVTGKTDQNQRQRFELPRPRILVESHHLRHEVRHRGTLDLHPDFGMFRPNQFRKDHTLFILAFDSVTRQKYFMNNYNYIFTDEQRRAARKLVESFNDRFSLLLMQRNEIMQVASDELDVKSLLVNNKVETLILNRLIRRMIHTEILTRAQRKRYTADVAERKSRREEAKAKLKSQPNQP